MNKTVVALSVTVYGYNDIIINKGSATWKLCGTWVKSIEEKPK
jgi:hypothetical protein